MGGQGEGAAGPNLQPEFNLETEKINRQTGPSSNMGTRFAAALPSPVFGLMSALLYIERAGQQRAERPEAQDSQPH